MANVKITADASGAPSAADVEALFSSCVRKVFTNQDVKALQQTCSRLATLCQVNSSVYNPNKKVLQDFRARYGLLDSKEAEKEKKKNKKDKKKDKKKAKKDKKKQEKAAKKAKKKAKKDKKGKKNKKERKREKKEKKEIKKKEKKEKKKLKKEQKATLKAEKKAVPKEERKKAEEEKKKAKKEKKKEKKQQKKLAKDAKKFSKEEKKLIAQELKLEKEEAKVALKIREFALKHEQKFAAVSKVKLSPSKIEKKLDEIRASLAARDASISRFAPCLLFSPDTGDSQCAVLRRASEFTLQAEECWAGYLGTLQHCKQSSSKKKVKACYKGFEVANARCGELALRGRTELQKLLVSERV